jgi:hypothetical protein
VQLPEQQWPDFWFEEWFTIHKGKIVHAIFPNERAPFRHSFRKQEIINSTITAAIDRIPIPGCGCDSNRSS